MDLQKDRFGSGVFWWKMVSIQMLALAVTAVGAYASASVGNGVIVLAGALAGGVLATLISHRLKLPSWWNLIHFCFPILVVIALWINLSPLAYLCFFALTFLFFGNATSGRVPLHLSTKEVWCSLDSLLDQKRGLRMVDLGCGFAGGISYLARQNPGNEFTGVESSLLPWLLARLRLADTGNAECQRRDLFDLDLSKFDLVYAYLSPQPMPALWKKASLEMRPGSLFISNSFGIDDTPPSQIITVNDRCDSKLYVWRI